MPDVAVLVEAVVASSEEHVPDVLCVPGVLRVPDEHVPVVLEGATVSAAE